MKGSVCSCLGHLVGYSVVVVGVYAACKKSPTLLITQNSLAIRSVPPSRRVGGGGEWRFFGGMTCFFLFGIIGFDVVKNDFVTPICTCCLFVCSLVVWWIDQFAAGTHTHTHT